MKCILLGLAALVGCVFLASVEGGKYGDQEYLEIQKDLLVALKYVHQPQWNADFYALGNSYKISEDYDSYNDLEAVKELVKMFKLNRFLGPQEFFSVYNPDHLEQAQLLFKVALAVKSQETLVKLGFWYRFNVNEKMFMYVVGLIIAHHKDVSTLIMPPPYEVCPYQYVHFDAIKFAQRQAMQGFYGVDKVNGYKEIIVPVNFTGWFMHMNDDQKVTYFTEDVAWNAFYYNFNVFYPYWLEGKVSGLDKDRRGELFITVHQQMLARYYLERLSNGLGSIPEFNWRQPVKSGYNSFLSFVNGKQFPSRPNNYNFYYPENYKNVEQAEDRERRIRDAVDAGFITVGGKTFSFSKPEDLNNLGNLIQGNPDSFDLDYDYMVPKFLESSSTAARDPLFYQYYKNLLQNYWRFMSHLKPYTVEEVGFPGVKINSVRVGKLETFFENFDIDITNAINVPQGDAFKKVEANFKPDEYLVKARTLRLNYKPFSYNIYVQSQKVQDASVRVYIGPKYDEFESVINFNDNRQNFVLLDIFKQSLIVGENVITRSSSQIAHYQEDYTTYFELYKRVLAGKSGEREWSNDLSKGHCKLPKHLMLPKGKKGGMPYQLYFIVSPYQSPATPIYSTFDPRTSCGIGSGSRYFEDRSLLFPLDREIDSNYFYTPNMYFEDVNIFFNAGENAVRYF